MVTGSRDFSCKPQRTTVHSAMGDSCRRKEAGVRAQGMSVPVRPAGGNSLQGQRPNDAARMETVWVDIVMRLVGSQGISVQCDQVLS